MWTEASQFLCRAEGGCEFRELPLVMTPSKVCPQCNAVVPIRLKVCKNRLKFALCNADRVNFKSHNYHVVAYNISILAEGLHFSALVVHETLQLVNLFYFNSVCSQFDTIPTCKEIKKANNLSALLYLGAWKANCFFVNKIITTKAVQKALAWHGQANNELLLSQQETHVHKDQPY